MRDPRPGLTREDTRSEIVRVGRQIRRDRAGSPEGATETLLMETFGDRGREGGRKRGPERERARDPGRGRGKQVDRRKMERTRERERERARGGGELRGSPFGREDRGRFPKRGGIRG